MLNKIAVGTKILSEKFTKKQSDTNQKRYVVKIQWVLCIFGGEREVVRNWREIQEAMSHVLNGILEKLGHK